jgi:hypothetical protein
MIADKHTFASLSVTKIGQMCCALVTMFKCVLLLRNASTGTSIDYDAKQCDC